MIYIHCKKMDEMWFAAAIRDEAIIATTFALNEKEVLEHLLKSLPYNMSFQLAKKSHPLSTKVLSASKSIFDGKNVSSNFRLDMKHLSDYAQKVLKCVSMVQLAT